ncbi:MAG: hypothetical protein QXN40_03420, partial [Candidatus Bathyarchaeia archaeon]
MSDMKFKTNILAAFLLTTFALSIVLANVPAASAQAAPKGPWVDEVVFSVETDEAKTVDMLLKNE